MSGLTEKLLHEAKHNQWSWDLIPKILAVIEAAEFANEVVDRNDYVLKKALETLRKEVGGG